MELHCPKHRAHFQDALFSRQHLARGNKETHHICSFVRVLHRQQLGADYRQVQRQPNEHPEPHEPRHLRPETIHARVQRS